ncbi:MAG: hypothetical protein ACRDZ1_00795 [Acidimicrobiia bacterium]
MTTGRLAPSRVAGTSSTTNDNTKRTPVRTAVESGSTPARPTYTFSTSSNAAGKASASTRELS